YNVYKCKLLPMNLFHEMHLCEVICRSAICFNKLIDKKLVSLKDLHAKTQSNTTLFYAGIQANTIISLDMFEWLKNQETKEDFLHQELLHIAQGNNDDRVEKVTKFCIDNGACVNYEVDKGQELIKALVQSF